MDPPEYTCGHDMAERGCPMCSLRHFKMIHDQACETYIRSECEAWRLYKLARNPENGMSEEDRRQFYKEMEEELDRTAKHFECVNQYAELHRACKPRVDELVKEARTNPNVWQDLVDAERKRSDALWEKIFPGEGPLEFETETEPETHLPATPPPCSVLPRLPDRQELLEGGLVPGPESALMQAYLNTEELQIPKGETRETQTGMQHSSDSWLPFNQTRPIPSQRSVGFVRLQHTVVDEDEEVSEEVLAGLGEKVAEVDVEDEEVYDSGEDEKK